MSKSPDVKGGLPRGRGRERAAAHLGGAAGTPVGLACGAAWARACGASLPSPWPPASPSCRSRPCGEPSGSQALSPGRIGPGRAWGGAVPSDLVPTDMVYEAVAHVQTPAGLAAQPRAGIPCRLHSDPGYRTAVTATTAAELRPRLHFLIQSMENKHSHCPTRGCCDASVWIGTNSARTLQAFIAPESSVFAPHDNFFHVIANTTFQ